MSIQLTSDNFDSVVESTNLPVLVDFYADWCGPCKMMAPVIDSLATEFEGKASIGKCNVDSAPDIAERYQIMSIPTLLFFKNGAVEKKIVGAVSKTELEQVLHTL